MVNSLVKNFFILTCLLMTIIMSQTVLCESRSISFSHHLINAVINENGNMDVEEIITYDFKGQYNGVFQDIDYNKSSGISNLKVYKAPSHAFESEESLILLKNNNSQKPDTYTYTNENKTLKIKLYTPSYNTQKTYVYKYTINKVVSKYLDTSELYWQFISADNETPNSNVQIQINIPEGSSKEELRIFAHGPLTGESKIVSGNKVMLTIDYLPPRNFIEARLLFPNRLITSAYPQTNRNMLDNILAEEKGWAEDSNKTREEARSRMDDTSAQSFFMGVSIFGIAAVAIISPIIMIAAAIFIYFKFIRQPKPQIDYDYYRDLPGDYTPAEVSVLINDSAKFLDISATILDLVRRKVLTITQTKELKDGIFFDSEITNYLISYNENYTLENLKSHEKFLLEWFIDRLGANGQLDLNNLQKKLKSNHSLAVQFQSNLSTWESKVKKEALQTGLIKNRELFNKSSSKSWILMILTIPLNILFFMTNPLNLIPIIIILVMLFKPVKTQLGLDHFYKWNSFKKYLQDFSMLDEASVPSLVVWEHYLVYAVSLGVAKEVIDQLKVVIPAEEFDSTDLTYLSSNSSFNINTGINNFSSLMNSISTSAIANSSNSSSGGHGGGFSSGGGGGGGGSRGGGF